MLLNGVDADITGLELDVTALVSESLILTAGMTALDSEYANDLVVPNGGGLGIDTALPIDGNQVAGAADLNITLALEHTAQLGGGELVTNLNARYSDGFFFEVENRVGTGEDGRGSSFSTVNGSLTYVTETWRASLWANNLTDEQYYRAGIVANALIESAIAGEPRTYGVSVTYQF